MSKFADTLARLKAHSTLNQQGFSISYAPVKKSDLAELLAEFERVDTAYRQLVPEYQQHIEQIQSVLRMTQRLVISEIGDFTAGLGHPGEPTTPEQIHEQLMARVQRVLTDIKQHVAGWNCQEKTSEEVATPGHEAALKRIEELMQSPLMLESSKREFELLTNLVVEYESLKYQITKAGTQ